MVNKYLLAIILLIASSFFWSGNFFAGKVAYNTDLSPFKLSFFRWTLAFIILLPFTYSEIRKNLKYYKENFLLMYTGITRYAETIEKTKIKKIKNNINNYDSIKELVDIMEYELKSGKKLNLKEIGKILNDAWNLKRKLTKKTIF